MEQIKKMGMDVPPPKHGGKKKKLKIKHDKKYTTTHNVGCMHSPVRSISFS